MKEYTVEDVMREHPHITPEEAQWLTENANSGNQVPIPRSGVGTGNGHFCFGERCVCHRLGEDKDSKECSKAKRPDYEKSDATTSRS